MPRKSLVKGVGAARETSTRLDSGHRGGFVYSSVSVSTLSQEFAMADLAFVVAVLAGFALAALVAKGATKL
ncbi:hypothetical protein [Streptomyces sp. NPDC008137]|uniref:hypothetical protein n=1 Tax=Streptomyces sp. NPDC008137 TaxID=3364813 RepID=UPI0036EA83C5